MFYLNWTELKENTLKLSEFNYFLSLFKYTYIENCVDTNIKELKVQSAFSDIYIMG